jgi:1-acyl-sn-glycerol-3-phosphate acyltransferase
MIKALSYILSVFYWVTFFICLLIFHPVQIITRKLFGYSAHQKTVAYLNWCLMACLRIIGSKVVFTNNQQLPKNKPLIFVANHQSMNDIPPLIWYLREFQPRFVSKIARKRHPKCVVQPQAWRLGVNRSQR